MVRNSTSADLHDAGTDNASTSGFHSIRDRFRFKRNPNPSSGATDHPKTPVSSSDRHWRAGRSHHHGHGRSVTRKLLLFPFRGRSWFYLSIFMVIFLFALASMVLQSSIMTVLRHGSERGRWSVIEDLKLGSSVEFIPGKMPRRVILRGGLDQLRKQAIIGIRPPRLGLILGNMKKDPLSLMVYTVMKNLMELGYVFKIYLTEDGEAHSLWEKIGQVSVLSPEISSHTDWSILDGIIVESLEANSAILSLMQEPFRSVPLIWIIQEDTLATRLPIYEDKRWEHLISYWKSSFKRADVVVFPDFSLPMLYSVLDTGNFFVIPASPIDVWAAESYSKTHSKFQLRRENGFNKDDMVILVVGSLFFYNELSWDYAVAIHDIGPLLTKYASGDAAATSFKFVFLCGNSTDSYNDALQDISTRLGLHHGSLIHYGLNSDVNSLLLMADILLYASAQEEQGFPPLLTRAMSFGLPVVAPDYPVIEKSVVNGVHALIFRKHNPHALMSAFSSLVSDYGKLSRSAHSIGSSGRLFAKNMLASKCIESYAKLLENAISFPSDAMLPGHFSQLPLNAWEWNLFQNEVERGASDVANGYFLRNYSVIYDIEEDMTNFIHLKNFSQNEFVSLEDDIPTELDWDTVREIESSEEVEKLEMEEIEERMEKQIGVWDDIYRNARKAEKLKFEANERDEGELERTGQPLCIYEIYNGAGAWPFLHHGSLYRGLSLSTRSRRSRSDDVDGVGRLPLLNDTYYQDVLCEIGGMFSIANGVDDIHKRPWIGFQSWRAAGRKISLSARAEQALEETIQEQTKGDTIYYWARLDMDSGLTRSNDVLTFWSMCDLLNGGNCRNAFQDTFRKMYGLPSDIDALPPMPEDGGHWSAMHSWVMPTPSFLEFIMFSRMFADSLDALHTNATGCLLGFSVRQKQHCYCRILEVLVNVWAYHSARKMVYIDPLSGSLQEQHPIKKRRGFVWASFFNSTLLKSMDEDLAEAADDIDYPREKWLWPLTGEVYWQGVYEREREERYRLKMDKKRKTKEKILERMKNGYKQKSLGG